MKIYRLKYNMPTFSAGDIAMLTPKGDLVWLGNENSDIDQKERVLHWRDRVVMYNHKTLERFKILDSWFEEVHEISERLGEIMDRPTFGDFYYCLGASGVEEYIWTGGHGDLDRKQNENIYMTREGAEEAQAKNRLIRRLDKLGVKMDTFSIGRDGHIYPTLGFPGEKFEEVNKIFKQLLGAEE